MHRLALALALLLGCTTSPPAGQGASEGASDDSTTLPTTTSDPSADPTDADGDDSNNFVTTDGSDLACDPWQQDCAPDDKCTHYNSMGQSDQVDATQCVPVPPDPKPTGNLCTATGGFGAGVDDCERGDFCYFLGDGESGICVQLCGGSEAMPECPDGHDCAHGLGPALYLCLPHCDPLLQDCIEGANCYPQSEGFVCAADISGADGAIYDPCDAANDCDRGLLCASSVSAPGCDADQSGCCLPMCAVGGEPCVDGLDCVPIFDLDTHPDLADHGYCADPA